MIIICECSRNPDDVNAKLCEQFSDSKLSDESLTDVDENLEVRPYTNTVKIYIQIKTESMFLISLFVRIQVNPAETAFVRFTPNSPIDDTDFANEVYNPPFSPDEDPEAYLAKGMNILKSSNIICVLQTLYVYGSITVKLQRYMSGNILSFNETVPET